MGRNSYPSVAILPLMPPFYDAYLKFYACKMYTTSVLIYN